MAVWQAIKSQNLSYGLRLDPEFYQPKYLELEKKLLLISTPLNDVVTELNTGRTPEYCDDYKTIPVIRSGDLDNFFIRDDLQSLLRTHPKNKALDLKKNDILISAIGRGSIGKISLYIGHGLATTVSEVIVLQKIKVNSCLLTAILSSEYGRLQIERQISGSTGQLHLIRQYLEKILVPKIERLEKPVEKLFYEAQILIYKSDMFYPEAEQELLERMEWNKVKNKRVLNYVVANKDITSNERLDPEFYQPKFENLEKHLKKIGVKILGDFCPMPTRGVQPKYDENGNVLVVNSKHLGPTEIDINNTERTTNAFYMDEANEKARIQELDVLMYSTGAYVGRTNSYLHDKKAMANNHVTIIRPNPKICNPIYLALFLNSPAGLMQTDQRASGSAQREIYPQEIVKYQVFIPRDKKDKPDLAWQAKLADKIVKANEAKKSAKQKLKKAKELVEKEIENLIH